MQGLVSGGGFTAVLTDDPAVGGTADPTVVALALPAIPMLEGWGLALLAVLLAALGVRRPLAS